jgi:hypothetical protein
MTRIHSYLIPALVILVLCGPAYAGSDDNSDFSLRCPAMRMVTVEPDSLSFESDMGQFVAGWTEPKEITAWVSANVPWVLSIKGSQESWEGPYPKPVSDISWSYGPGAYVPLSTSSATVVAGELTNRQPYPINIKVKLDLSKDFPGDYHYYNIVVELSEP